MRLSQPSRATQLNTQASSACSATWLWLNTMCFFGSIPQAMNAAVTSRIVRGNSAGSCHVGDGVQIDDAIDAVVAILQLDEAFDGAEIIAEVQVAGRLHAGKYQFFEGHIRILRAARVA